jgi:hypothetical protein
MKECKELFPCPTREISADELAAVNDDSATDAYKTPFKTHLQDATEAVVDAAWGTTNGRRYLKQQRQLKDE